MRRLIDWLRCRMTGLRLRTLDQFIADQQTVLNDLADQRDGIDQQIDAACARIINALQVRDALAKAHNATRPAPRRVSDIPRISLEEA